MQLEDLLNDIPYEAGYNAHRGTSFVPEQRAKQEQTGHAEWPVESEPVAEVDHVAAIRSRLQTKLDALRDDHTQKTAAFHSLGKQIDTLSAQIADVENSLHVLTDHIALHLAS